MVCSIGSLTITYFHTGIRTIIGVESFHGPVRDGKGWDRLAMVIRLRGLPVCARRTRANLEKFNYGVVLVSHRTATSLFLSRMLSDETVLKRTGYRIKPHGQLVLVSLTHYCASTPSLSTSWSRTTLQGNQVPRDISSQGEFPA